MTENINTTWSEHLNALVNFFVGPGDVDQTPFCIEVRILSWLKLFTIKNLVLPFMIGLVASIYFATWFYFIKKWDSLPKKDNLRYLLLTFRHNIWESPSERKIDWLCILQFIYQYRIQYLIKQILIGHPIISEKLWHLFDVPIRNMFWSLYKDDKKWCLHNSPES